MTTGFERHQWKNNRVDQQGRGNSVIAQSMSGLRGGRSQCMMGEEVRASRAVHAGRHHGGHSAVIVGNTR
ncbi:hypothetical protein ElyMa_007049000 [Elysia marginata]|uniref:Uncharacterized protein n=1 Tax=Elysia marginata TaxID=1093978 RepID=A0AAV4JU05_9GAST|nr:hypothetical protein ElyMa_007049000 [Elysia marginata]